MNKDLAIKIQLLVKEIFNDFVVYAHMHKD